MLNVLQAEAHPRGLGAVGLAAGGGGPGGGGGRRRCAGPWFGRRAELRGPGGGRRVRASAWRDVRVHHPK